MILFESNFTTGFDEWAQGGLVEESGSILTSQAAALAGTTKGLECISPGGTGNVSHVVWGLLDPIIDYAAGSRAMRMRFHFNPNNMDLPNNGDEFLLMRLLGLGTYTHKADINVVNSGGNKVLEIRIRDEGGTWRSGSSSFEYDEKELRLELLYELRSTMGYLELHVDGVKKVETTGHTLSTEFSAIRVNHFGITAKVGNTAGTIYLDELVVTNDNKEIGPAQWLGYRGRYQGSTNRRIRYGSN